MAPFKPSESDYSEIIVDGKRKRLLSKIKFNAFNATILGLGDLTLPATTTEVIAAKFDLGGFADFWKQLDTQLAVPLFLSEFLSWFMEQLRLEMKQKDHGPGVILWSPLPFFVKFTGDGLLVLWDAAGESEVGLRNIIVNALVICGNYKKDFLGSIRRKVAAPPPLLRCGLARGSVYSVGEGRDYVGDCINMVAGLQSLPGITFCFNRRGFDLEVSDKNTWFKRTFLVRRISRQGVGDNELIGILREEFATLKPADKKHFGSSTFLGGNRFFWRSDTSA